jgi:putative DNA primase/helicase
VLLQWLFGWSFPETLLRVAGVVGLTDVPGKPITPAFARMRFAQAEPPNPKRARRSLRRIWSQSLSPLHPDAWPLQRYLSGRGLDASVLHPRVVRFHPALAYWSGDRSDRPICLGRFPAMLALVSDTDGRPLTLHRTYLRPDGLGKAPVPSPKKLMPHAEATSLSGGAIRLFAVDAPEHMGLGIAEGVETALAVHAMTGLPVWACASATLLQGFCPPAGTRRLSIWADKDRSDAGELAASVLRQRLRDLPDVRILLPPDPIPASARGIDWADVWLMRQSAAADRAVA